MSYAHSFLCAYLWWRDQSVCREHSDGWQDREVCLTDIQPNSISLFYRSSFGWCTFSALTWLAPGDEAKLQCTSEKSRLMWMQKNTPVPRLNKGISCQEKGDKTAVLSRVTKGVAKLSSVVATATPGHPLAPPLPPGTCSKGDEAMLRYFREEDES